MSVKMFNLAVLSLFIFSTSTFALFSGDPCIINDNSGVKAGKCQEISKCDYTKQLIEQKRFPLTCGFIGLDPLICCPMAIDLLRSLPKSQLKCEEYFDIRNWGVGIYGGIQAKINEFPHMAALGYQSEESSNFLWLCGGSLISENFILTAAHCTNNIEFGNPKLVRLGDLNLNQTDDDDNSLNIEISKIFVHPDYKPPAHYHDIALLKLNKTVTFTPSIKPACLHYRKKIPKKTAQAIGWGQTEFLGDQSNLLLKAALKIIEHEKCAKAYTRISSRRLQNGIMDDKQICAGDPSGKDTCPGDSGGPLQVRNKGFGEVTPHFVLIGVTSFGRGCGFQNSVGVYTRVSAYRKWIEDIVWSRSYDFH